MCWPHWRRVPRALNKAIFATVHDRDRTAYNANVDEAVRIIQEKERADSQFKASGGFVQGGRYIVGEHGQELKIGDRMPLPPRKIDIRPAFTGAGSTSFKPARKPPKF